MSNNLQVFIGKLEVTNEIGETLDKQLQLAENATQQLSGGSAAFKVGAEKVGALGVHVDKDLEEGKLAFASELEASAYIKKYIIRASEVLLNLAEKSKNEELVAHGRVAAIKESMEVVKKHAFAAKSRAEQIVAAQEEMAKLAADPDKLAEDDRGARMPGQHPGRSSLDERRAERDAAKAQAAAPAESAPEPETPPEQPPADPFAPPAVRQKRPYRKRQKVASE